MDIFERARDLVARGRYDGAMRTYEKIAEASPRDERALCGMALVAMVRVQKDYVLTNMELALSVRPDAAYPHGIVGMVLHSDGRLDEALASYGRMLSADSGEASAYVRKAQILRSQGKEQECAEAIKSCLDAPLSGRESPKEKRRLREMGRRVASGEPPVFRFEDDGTFLPGLWEMLDVLFGPDSPGQKGEFDFDGVTLAGRGDYAECMASLDEIIATSQDSAAWCMKGMLLSGEGSIDEALACYDRAVEAEPGEMLAYSNKAELLADRGDLDGARECLRTALDAKPSNQGAARLQYGLQAMCEYIERHGRHPGVDSISRAGEVGRWAAWRRAGMPEGTRHGQRFAPGSREPRRRLRGGRRR